MEAFFFYNDFFAKQNAIPVRNYDLYTQKYKSNKHILHFSLQSSLNIKKGAYNQSGYILLSKDFLRYIFVPSSQKVPEECLKTPETSAFVAILLKQKNLQNCSIFYRYLLLFSFILP